MNKTALKNTTMNKDNIKLALAALGVVLVGVAVVIEWRAPVALLFGWIPFLSRTLRRVTVDVDAIVYFAVLMVLFFVGLHLTARWFYVRVGSEKRLWKIRWTAILVVGVMMLFTSGIAVTGLIHQTSWIASSPNPIYRSVYVDKWTPSSESNLKHTGLTAHNYHDIYKKFPAGCTYDDQGQMLHGWGGWVWTQFGARLPSDVVFDMRIPWDHPTNVPALRYFVPPLMNPELQTDQIRDERGFALAHYAANSHVMGWKPAMSVKEITDGTSNTLFIGEVNSQFKAWGSPTNWRDPTWGINKRPDGFGGVPGKQGVSFLMCDGSVRFINENVEQSALKSLATPDGNDNEDDGDQTTQIKERPRNSIEPWSNDTAEPWIAYQQN